MATSTLIQYLESAQVTGLGTSVAVGRATSDRSQIETFIAKEAIAAGDLVAFDYAATEAGDVTLGVFKADAAPLPGVPVRTPFGVALTGAADGKKVTVVLSGAASVLVAANATGTDFPLGTLLQVTGNAGEAGVASAASAQPVCAILTQVQPNGAGAQLRRCVVIKQF